MGKEIVRISLSGVCKSGGRTVEATTRVRVSARGDPGKGGGEGQGCGPDPPLSTTGSGSCWQSKWKYIPDFAVISV